MTTTDASSSAPAQAQSSAPGQRSRLRSVAMPSEHGGWGLTGEPVLLGLAVAPSIAGLCIGVAAVLAFLARTPLRIVLVDRHRHRDLERTALARRVLAVEVAVIIVLAAIALWRAETMFWWPVLIAAPLVAIELVYDMRSRSRRLAPELAGTFGICSVAAMILLAGGRDTPEAIAVWLILAARATTAIPHVRALIARMRGRTPSSTGLLLADAAALALAVVAAVLAPATTAGAVAVAAVVVIQRVTATKPAPPKVVGIRQTILGLGVVVATVIGIHLA